MGQWTEPLLSPWFVCPIGICGLLVIAWHVNVLCADSSMPASRRRIRSVTNATAAATIPLLTAGLCVIAPDQRQLFGTAWLVSAGLLLLVLMLASIDLLNTMRLHAIERREQRQHLRAMRHEVDAILRQHRTQQVRAAETSVSRSTHS